MPKYADVYLLPILEKNVPAYKKLAIAAGKVFVKHGALRYREYVASDLDAQGIVLFNRLLKLKAAETIIYAAVEFKSEAHRKRVMKKIFADLDMMPPPGTEKIFDHKRMVTAASRSSSTRNRINGTRLYYVRKQK